MLLRGGGKSVGVQDQSCVSEARVSGAHISGSTSSKASSMTLVIRTVSLRRSFSFPMCLIHGFWPAAGAVFNLSSTASVTNCRRGMPCSAAFDFARRKIVSGISNVVFIRLIFPYLWDMRQMLVSGTHSAEVAGGFLRALVNTCGLVGVLAGCKRNTERRRRQGGQRCYENDCAYRYTFCSLAALPSRLIR